MKNGFLLVLSKEKARFILKDIYREKYINKYRKNFKILSLDINNDSNKSIELSSNYNLENFILKKILIEKLKEVLKLLNREEYDLIYEIYYNNKTIREYAEIKGLDQSTMNFKKKRILKKLKIFLKKYHVF